MVRSLPSLRPAEDEWAIAASDLNMTRILPDTDWIRTFRPRIVGHPVAD